MVSSKDGGCPYCGHVPRFGNPKDAEIELLTIEVSDLRRALTAIERFPFPESEVKKTAKAALVSDKQATIIPHGPDCPMRVTGRGADCTCADDKQECEHKVQSSRTFCDVCGEDLGSTFGVEITADDPGRAQHTQIGDEGTQNGENDS